jgi:hypothetical protein
MKKSIKCISNYRRDSNWKSHVLNLQLITTINSRVVGFQSSQTPASSLTSVNDFISSAFSNRPRALVPTMLV